MAGLALSTMMWAAIVSRSTASAGECDADVAISSLTLDLAITVGTVTSVVIAAPDGDQVGLRWSATDGFDCVWIAARQGTQPDYPAKADLVVMGAGGFAIDAPKGPPGTFCFYVIPMAGSIRGRAGETCLNLANPAPAEIVIEAPQVQPPAGAARVGDGWSWPWVAVGLGIGVVASAVFVLPSVFRRRRRAATP